MGCLEPGVPIPSCHGFLLHPGHHFCTCERGAGCCETEQIRVLRPFGIKCWEKEQQQGHHSPPAHPESLQSFAAAAGRDCGKPSSSLLKTKHQEALTKFFPNKKIWVWLYTASKSWLEITGPALLPHCPQFLISIGATVTPGTKPLALLPSCILCSSTPLSCHQIFSIPSSFQLPGLSP